MFELLKSSAIDAGVAARCGDDEQKSSIKSSAGGFDPTPRKCIGCGKMVVDLTTCPHCGTYNRAP